MIVAALILSLALAVGSASGQIRSKTLKPDKIDSLVGKEASAAPTHPDPAVEELFESIEKGLQSGSVTSFSENLGTQVFINISGGESGYFSANQFVSVLQNYFAHRKPLSFTFSRLNSSTTNPYATGRLSYQYKGNREYAQIYISLARRDSRWVVSQFSIY